MNVGTCGHACDGHFAFEPAHAQIFLKFRSHNAKTLISPQTTLGQSQGASHQPTSPYCFRNRPADVPQLRSWQAQLTCKSPRPARNETLLAGTTPARLKPMPARSKTPLANMAKHCSRKRPSNDTLLAELPTHQAIVEHPPTQVKAKGVSHPPTSPPCRDKQLANDRTRGAGKPNWRASSRTSSQRHANCWTDTPARLKPMLARSGTPLANKAKGCGRNCSQRHAARRLTDTPRDI